MRDGSRPGSLLEIASEAKKAGATGMLISGGCDIDGKVPILERAEEILEVKRAGLMLNIHTGLLDDDEADRVAGLGAERLSMDLHQSTGVIRGVLHLSAGPSGFERTLRALCRAAPGRVVPHICAGLEGDTIEHELRCVDLAAEYGAAGLVILVHMPTQGATLHIAEPISDRSVLRLIDHAVARTDVPVLLGCMRPRKDHLLELEAARHGVFGIANPKERTLSALENEGFHILHRNECCALHL